MKQQRIKLFVHCGDREPPDPSWTALPLKPSIGPQDLPAIISRIRQALRGFREADILLAGPVCLGVAVGQSFEHSPVKIRYWQLNQPTKEYEVWLTNMEHLGAANPKTSDS
jgi:hypothetical protein